MYISPDGIHRLWENTHQEFSLFLLGLFVDRFEKFYIERLTTVEFNLRKKPKYLKINPNIKKKKHVKSN